MGKSGLKPDGVYFTNTVKCRPLLKNVDGTLALNKEGKPQDRAPTKEEIAHCSCFLQEELTIQRPNLVLALGASALYAFKDTNQIGKFRGVPFKTPTGQKVLATFHPAALMRQQHMFPAVITDLQTAAAEAKSPNLHVANVQYRIDARPDTFGPDVLLAARQAGYLVFDWETTGLRADTSTYQCVGLTSKSHEAACFPWSPGTQRLMEELFADPRIEIVGQNSEDFDLRYWEEKGNPTPVGRTFDTMLGFHLVNPDLPKKLEAIGSYHARDVQPWKGPNMYKGSFEDLQKGCCTDVDVTCRAYLDLQKEMALIGVKDLYYNSVMPLQPVLRRMTRGGIKKDIVRAAKIGMGLLAVAERKEKLLRDGLGKPYLNLNSPKQLMELLYEDLGLPVQYAKSGKHEMRPTANAEAMDKLAELTDNPIFHLVNEVRTARKWKSTFADVETDDDDYAHPHFGCAKAANGRLNSWDFNAQNVPNDMRVIWIPDSPDHVFISTDWSQIEWRIAMALAGDEAGLRMFASGIDMHTGVAAEVDGLRIEDVTPQLRHMAKFIVYGLAYGREARSIAKARKIDLSVAQDFVTKFFGKFHRYKAHRDLQSKFVEKNSYLRNPFSRRRWWYTRTPTEEYNFNPSSSAADMMYLVMPKVEQQLPAGARMVLTVHDELVTCAHRNVAAQAAECMKQCMQRVFDQITEASLYPDVVRQYYPNGWWAPVEVSFGTNWSQCKEKTPVDKAASKQIAKEVGYAH
jgi:DNA polymerase-1